MGTQKSSGGACGSRLSGTRHTGVLFLTVCLLAAPVLSSVQADVPANSFEGGGSFSISNTDYNYGSENISIGQETSGNTLTISGSTLSTTGGLYLGAQLNGARDNTLLINGGSNITVASLNLTMSAGKFSGDSEIILSGPGTSLSVTSGIVSSGTTSHHNDFTANNSGKAGYITVSDGALLKMDAWRRFPASKPYIATPIRMDGGFYAFKGDMALDSGDKSNYAMGIFTYWDADLSAWTYASALDYDEFIKHFSVVYYETEEAGYADTGHWGLGGYTVVSAIPEPSTTAAAFAAVLGVIALLRLRRR